MEADIEHKLQELREKREIARLGGGKEKIEKQHKHGKLTARERLELLLDPGSFFELGQFVTHRCRDFGMDKERYYGDGVVTGYGTINGRRVYVFSQDFTVLGGSLGEAHAMKICEVLDYAIETGSPIIGLNDSGGARIQEGPSHYGAIFCRNVLASGYIPQISAILGPCAGGASYSPALTDFVFMVKGISYMFITGPRAVKAVTGEELTVEQLGGPEVHGEISGVAHFVAESEVECMKQIKRLLSFLPSNCMEKPPTVNTGDDPNRMDESLNYLIPVNPRKPYDIKDLILKVVDGGDFLEVQENFARNIVVGFARMNGETVGIIANQPKFLAGSLDINASVKAARFIRFCDAFNIPLITLVDCPAYLPGKQQEHGGIIRHGAKMLYAYCEASVPKITIVLRKVYGGALSGMCVSKHLSDITLALPTAEIAVLGPEAAVEILFRKEIAASENPEAEKAKRVLEYREKFCNPYVAAERGYIDGVIEAREIRPTVISLLKALKGKVKRALKKKHGIIPL